MSHRSLLARWEWSFAERLNTPPDTLRRLTVAQFYRGVEYLTTPTPTPEEV